MRFSLVVCLLLVLTGCSNLKSNQESESINSKDSVERIYQEAKELMDDGNYQLAVKKFELLQTRYPYGKYAQQALLETAYSYFKQDEPEAASSAVERFIKLYPNNKYIDYAYYLRGLINFNGDLSLAQRLGGLDPTERDPKAAQTSFEAFRDLITQYPESKYVPDAKIRMQYLTNALAQYELHVAEYYMRRGAYVAAVNRAKNLLTLYPNSPSTRDALGVMVAGYDKLGMYDLRDDSMRVLKKNSGDNLPDIVRPKEWWQFWR